jgi:AcrR family transcriptional regulator
MALIEKKEDRRIQRTRALLRDALHTLIVEKGYTDISIQDITDRANVARTTFYLHFADKDDLLFNTMKDIYEELFNTVTLNANSIMIDEGNISDGSDLIHVRQFKDFYKVMLSEKGSITFLIRVQRLLAMLYVERVLRPLVKQGAVAKIPLDLVGYMMAGEQIGAIMWWLETDLKMDMEHLSDAIEQICARGIRWAFDAKE